jgi:hypothetical protein
MMFVRLLVSVASLATLTVCGCGESSPAFPVGLKTPNLSELKDLDAKEFKIIAVAAKVWLPKDNPVLTGDTKKDAVIKTNLPQLRCIVEFETDTAKSQAERFSVGLSISAPYGEYMIVHSSGGESAKRREDGKFVAEVMLSQSRPLALDSKATIGLRVLRYVEGSTTPIEANTKEGTVTILESQE